MYFSTQTERLRIRPIVPSDREFIFSLTNSSGWIEFIGDRNIKTLVDAESYIRNILAKQSYFYNVVELVDIDQPIGLVTFLQREEQAYPDFGFAMLPQYEGRGYMLEAAATYLTFLEISLAVPYILGITMPQNHKSINLLLKLGFSPSSTKLEGDTVTYSKQIRKDNSAMALQ